MTASERIREARKNGAQLTQNPTEPERKHTVSWTYTDAAGTEIIRDGEAISRFSVHEFDSVDGHKPWVVVDNHTIGSDGERHQVERFATQDEADAAAQDLNAA